ncbi:hypothetical protein BpHYR1_036951 [Brachionus plicatilis]|uniref:Uncharacterized protein n=1 Tax=Brachionus plicatilis TaxID=10195 RepID=A0A3M7S918_BRAPC|nr:hypothetical protein BpHYR1_036951 [Brachionus plicatilis]
MKLIKDFIRFNLTDTTISSNQIHNPVPKPGLRHGTLKNVGYDLFEVTLSRRSFQGSIQKYHQLLGLSGNLKCCFWGVILNFS